MSKGKDITERFKDGLRHAVNVDERFDSLASEIDKAIQESVDAANFASKEVLTHVMQSMDKEEIEDEDFLDPPHSDGPYDISEAPIGEMK